jgi:hypothetical protein
LNSVVTKPVDESDGVLTLVGQDGRIRRTPWSDRPPYHHGLPEIVLGDDLREVVLGE